ncbi:MAG: DUF2188 domain-containing protein [Xanthobacteraceae bacterium]
MRRSRFVVVSEEQHWTIVRGARGHIGSYATKTQAMRAAIEFAEQAGQDRGPGEVLVRHEDGRFLMEWCAGEDAQSAKAPRPVLTARAP